MNKKVWMGFVAVFVVMQILEYIVNMVLLDSLYKSVSELWRPEGEMKVWLFVVVGLFFSFFFTLIFSKGYEGKGIMEGVRYGLYVALMVVLPFSYGTYAMMPIPYSLALQWFLYGTVEYIIAGIVLALIFARKEAPAPAS